MKKAGARLILAAIALTLVTTFQNCGGGGGGGDGGNSANSNWYYHFDCNGDPGCLSTNPNGKSCGDLNEGPSQPMCQALIYFGNNFWNAPAAHWCDTNPTGSTCSGGVNAGAPIITGLNSTQGPGNQNVVVFGSHFPSTTGQVSAKYCGKTVQVMGTNSTQVTVKIPFATSCKSPITITTAAGSADSPPYIRYNSLRAAASNGSNIVVVGDNGTIITSPDGVTWTVRVNAIDCGIIACSLRTVNWNGSQFLTAGDNLYVLRSYDGNTWDELHKGGILSYFSLIWTGSQYVAGASGGWLATSPDGGTFTGGSAPSDIYYGLAYNGSTIITASQQNIRASTDGVNWTAQLPVGGGFRYSAAWSGTQFMVVGAAGAVYVSPDGITPANWLASNAGTSFDLNGLTYADNKFVAVGNSGTIRTYQPVGGWVGRTSGTGEHLNGVAWVGNQFIALGAKNTILTSPDGITWTARPLFQ